jgi:plastocyanin
MKRLLLVTWGPRHGPQAPNARSTPAKPGRSSILRQSLRLALLAASLALGAGRADALEVVITATAIEPRVPRVPTGERVDFVNRAQSNVHVEFGADPRQHEVVQIPLTGPIWAVFHRPGTHPYAVHVYGGGRLTTLQGLVEVVDDPEHPWSSLTCGAVVEGNCIEP